ncbi:hypothetical protein GCM10010308_51530 [Streptomyces vinaceusdrappus]|nr:hypothetical protein GCM10010301_53010 [Streptomyces plicatus]GHC28080.1 hypothetical protein GCM10010308_51530 [Streptomyces vinaceusdrappus]
MAREPCPLWLQDERVHLTADGCHSVAAAFGWPRAPTLTTTRPVTSLNIKTARTASR